MAETLKFELVSPEKRLLAVDATAVQLPGMEGDMTAMPDHAPLITGLRPGVVSVSTGGVTQDFVVTGGFAEINAEATTVLAEQAVPKAEVKRELLDHALATAEAALESATDDGGKTAAAQRINDINTLVGELGL